MTLFVCTAVRQHCSCSFGFLQDQRQIGISHLTDVSRIAGALHSGYTNGTRTKTKEGIPMQTLSSRCSGLLLLLMLALLLTACTTSAAPERLTTAPESVPPEGVVRMFYQTWISAEGNPINERIYDNTDYLTTDFIQRIDDHIVAQGGIAADPLLCAQNRLSQIEVGEHHRYPRDSGGTGAPREGLAHQRCALRGKRVT
jgi:hypothetical protein